MKHPQVLIIGAMKCGTATLYNDLCSQAALHLPDKELNVLSEAQISAAEATRRYEALFGGTRPQQVGVDLSTTYTMLPDRQGVARLAREVCGPETKIVYLVRDPLRRAVSHHFHMYSRLVDSDRMESDVNLSVARHPQIVEYGRYWMQLEPWREQFPDKQIRVILFEEYIENREATIASLCDFWNVEFTTGTIDAERIYNQSEDKPVLNRFWASIHAASWYRKAIRPLVPQGMKQALRETVLPKAPARPMAPHSETEDYILSCVRRDVEQLAAYLGRERLWEGSTPDDSLLEAA